ncbi:hypothetical protein ACFWPU_00805 [Streptomyces sp. NPDC058471]|uniref:hypothetical protein n=1 Tax=Streptomyces sp. NPDC058471 TaxID=3346516 RepID=UPI003663327C
MAEVELVTASQKHTEAIRRHLQDYLGIPAEERTPHRYEQLVTALTAAAETHTREFVSERRQEQKRRVLP